MELIMLRKFKIKTRLLISFFIVVFFTLVVGITGFAGLTSIGDMSVETINNVRILNDVYDYCTAVESEVFSMLYTENETPSQYDILTTKYNIDVTLRKMDNYLDVQELFADIFSPEEMQDITANFDVYRNAYIPQAYEILDLLENGRRDEALSISINRLNPLYNSIMLTISSAFLKNLEYSEIVSKKNNENAFLSASIMLILVILSVLVSIALALAVTKSIALPLSELELSAEKVAGGDLNVKFSELQSGDEIDRLTMQLRHTLNYLNQAQRLKIEAMNARYEKEKAQASARSKSSFLAKMSHEIRTPMNAIMGMAELALREEMADTARDQVLTIKQASVNLLSLINDIIDFTKIDSGKLEIAPVEYLFSYLINDIINIIKMRFIDSKVRFIVNADSNIPDELFGDEIRVRQILLNILNNAFKYTEEGFVSLSIQGEIHDDIVKIKFEITDTGRGIKDEDIAKLFGDFSQVDTGNSNIEGTGVSLAIAQSLVRAMDGNIGASSKYGEGSTFTVVLPQKICGNRKLEEVNNPHEKRVLVYEQFNLFAASVVRTVKNLGVECRLVLDEAGFSDEITNGKYNFLFIASYLYDNVKNLCLKVSSDVKIILLTGYHDVVTDRKYRLLSMPVHPLSVANILNGAAADSAYDENSEVKEKFTAPNAKILVVDDINTNLKVVEGLLLPYKMQIDLCGSGREAIEAVKQKSYDLVFMDHMMPEMDGIEAAGHIRGWELEQRKETGSNTGRPLPIIALTANAVTGMREMFLERGFSDFITKPIDVLKLHDILCRWIPQEKKQAAAADEETEIKNETGKTSEFANIPGVDTAKGILMTGGTEAGYRAVLSIFARDAEERARLLRKMTGTETLHVFTTQVHAIKGASATIGAAETAARAAELEAAGRAGNIDFIQEKLEEFTYKINKLTKNIRTVLGTDTPGVQEQTSNADDLYPLLYELETAVNEKNVSAIDRLMNEINGRQIDPKTHSALEKISDELLMAEFENAAISIRNFLNDK